MSTNIINPKLKTYPESTNNYIKTLDFSITINCSYVICQYYYKAKENKLTFLIRTYDTDFTYSYDLDAL